MVRISPNKRKLSGAGVQSPFMAKMIKTEDVLPKTPGKTPKKMKSEEVLLQTPGKTPKKIKVENVLLQTPGKTPKNINAGEAFLKTPGKTPKKMKTEETFSPAETAVKTPKSKPTSPVKNESGKLNKFAGTKKLGPVNIALPVDEDEMTKRQKRRKISKLKKIMKIADKKATGANETNNIAEIAELTSNGNRNKKNQSIINKLAKTDIAQSKNIYNKKGKQQTPKKNGRTSQKPPKVGDELDEDMETDESDYDVESVIKPEKFTMKLNNTSSDDKELDQSEDSDVEDESDEASAEESDEASAEEESDEASAEEEGDEASAEEGDDEVMQSKKLEGKNQIKSGNVKQVQSKYILFVNKLPLNTTKEQIIEHFKNKCEVKDVRIPLDRVSGKPRGFAYVEVCDEEAYQKAVSLNHTVMGDQQIWVKHTQSGHKNSLKEHEIKKKQFANKNQNESGPLTKSQSKHVLFVNELPYDITKDQIIEHFKNTCEVKEVRIPLDRASGKSRGFAFVEVHNEEASQKALSLDQTTVGSRQIKVVLTQDGNSPNKKPETKKKQFENKKPRESGPFVKGQSRYVVYMNQIPYDTTKEQIIEHFKNTCEVKDVRIPIFRDNGRPRGFAYVELHNEEAYQKSLSLNHTILGGRRINIEYTQGGVNSPNKKQEIKKKNLKLHGMRKQGLLAGSNNDSQKRSVRRAKKRSFDEEKNNDD